MYVNTEQDSWDSLNIGGCWKGESNVHGRFIPFILKDISGNYYFWCKFRLSGWNGD